MSPTSNPSVDPLRRVPTQARSRLRVQTLLDAAADVVVRDGVEAVTTRSIAAAARMPVASLYQYFADKDALLLALVDRDMSEMNEQLYADLAKVTEGPMPRIIRTIMEAHVTVLARRPAFVEIYLAGRTNVAVNEYVRSRNRELTALLFSMGQKFGLLTPETREDNIRLGLELGDRMLQVAYEVDRSGDPGLLDAGIKAITHYMEQYSAPPS